MIARHLTFAAVVLCACALIIGCEPRRDPSAFRLITGDAHGRLDTQATRHVVFSWDFATASDLEAWTIENADGEGTLTERGLAMRSSSNDPFLWRRAAVEAEAVDAIQVYLRAAAAESGDSGSNPGMVQLFWAAADESFSTTRQMAVAEPSAELDGGVFVYQFPVAGDPSWEGGIDRLRLDPTNLPRMRVILGRIEGIREELPDPSLPRNVVLGSEQRLALLVPPDSPRELIVDVPPTAVLRFGYGLLGGEPRQVSHPAELRVAVAAAERRQATQVQASDRTLFTAAFPAAGAPSARGWMEARVRLDGFAGQRLELRFESTVPGGFSGIPVVSNPELYSTRPSSQPPNVVLICVDTLRADHLSLYGYRKVTSPAIDAWARDRAVTFQTAVAPSPWTLPSHVSMFSGLSALRHGVNYNSPPENITMLADYYRRAGYFTLAFTGGAFLHPKFGFSQGFDSYRYSADAMQTDELEKAVDRTLAWLDTHRASPFFMLLHTYAVHGPYRARQPFAEAFGGLPEGWADSDVTLSHDQRLPDDGFQERQWFVRRREGSSEELPVSTAELPMVEKLYDTGIAYADEQLSRLWQALEETGLDQRTVVIVTSDHGEALGEKGKAMHGDLYDSTLMVPLIVALPGAESGGLRIAEQVSLVDVVPTALELTDMPVPAGLDGSSLVPLIAGEAPASRREAWSYGAASNYGVTLRISNRLKYIYNDTVWAPAAGHEELYRLLEDPEEEHNVAEAAPETPRLRQRVREALRERHRGLTLEFENAGSATFRGILRGPLGDPTKAKSPDLSCPCVKWQDKRGAGLIVAPGESFTLFFKNARAKVRLTGAVDGGDELAVALAPNALSEPWQRSWDGTDWRPGGQGTMRITVQWKGGLEARAPEAVTPDAALVEQLRALGYVD